MSRRWMNAGSRVWAPRALAVLSCALALLAAQPVLAEADRHRAPVPVTSSAPTTPASQQKQVVTASRTSVKATPADAAFFTSARRLHIVATVEILKRLLTAELQPASERLLFPALLLEPTACIDLLSAPLRLPHIHAGPGYPSLPPPERRFVLEHTQLAPPLV